MRGGGRGRGGGRARGGGGGRARGSTRGRGGGIRKKNKSSPDPFFEPSDPKKRRRLTNDEDIESDEEENLYGSEGDDDAGEQVAIDEEEEAEEETAAEKKYRIAKAHLEKVHALTKKMQDEEDEDDVGGSDDDGEERRGKTNALVADFLQREQLERSGRALRLLAARILRPEAADEFRILQKHRQPVTALALSGDDSRGFSTSKDGVIMHWDVESGAREKYRWPDEEKIEGGKKQSKHVLALAVSSDGRYLATGGMDRLVHLWDTRTREHLQAFKGHKAPVSCLTFREGTPELFSGSFDNSIKWWNVADRTHLDNLFGHEAGVLTIDCLRKERVLSVGRDRTMRLFKVIEAVSLRYSAPSSALECCCFINNDEFLSGSDDGSVELWSMLRKKPICIVKNAHSVSAQSVLLRSKDGEMLSNGVDRELGHQNSCSLAQSWVSSVTVCKGSDLAASGAGNGIVRLWAIESDSRSIKPLYDLPLVGFANSLAFAKSGRFLLAGVGQEPRLGRWGRVTAAVNGVALFPLKLSGRSASLTLILKDGHSSNFWHKII